MAVATGEQAFVGGGLRGEGLEFGVCVRECVGAAWGECDGTALLDERAGKRVLVGEEGGLAVATLGTEGFLFGLHGGVSLSRTINIILGSHSGIVT